MFILGEDLDYLDGEHCVFGEIVEGWDTLDKINSTICDGSNRPYQVRSHTFEPQAKSRNKEQILFAFFLLVFYVKMFY